MVPRRIANSTNPQLRNVYRLYRQSTGETDNSVYLFGGETAKPHRLPYDIAELRFPVRRGGQLPLAGKETSCFFARPRLSQDGRSHHIRVHHQPYARPCSIAA
jgi:hypothetical protein